MKYIILCLFKIIIFSQIVYAQTNIPATATNIKKENILSLEDKRIIFINTTLSNASKKNLIGMCENLNISKKGSKKELLIRIKAFLEMEQKDKKEMRDEAIDTAKKDVIIIEQADEGQYLKINDKDQEILSAEGNVHLIYNKMRLKADKVKLNVQTKEMHCEGNVILFDGTKEITGREIFYNLNTEMGIIYQGKSKLGDLIYKGEKIKKVHNDAYIISKGQFTSCDEDIPHYYIEAKKMWIYPDNKIVLLDAYYVIADVKVFWIPLYFRFSKGTGIVTSWGRRQVEGWYMQNTYRFKISKTADGDIKFDHYQRRGEYFGFDMHQDSKDSEILFSTSGAYDKKIYGDSNINPDTGKIDRESRGKVSLKNRLTFNRDSKNDNYNTTLRASIFRQTDYSYIRDFETYRAIKPGFFYNENPMLHNDLYNQDVNKWYINLSDVRKNSSFYVKADWHFAWNPILEEYKMNYANIPELSYSLNGVLWEEPKLSSTNTIDTNQGFRIYPKIRYNTTIRLTHQDYFDEEGRYLKSLDSRRFDLDISRSFGLYDFITYRPSLGVGNQAFWAYNVDEVEKENKERNTYSYGNVRQGLQLGPSSIYLNFNHYLKYRFKDPGWENEYGKIVSHNLGMVQRTAPFSGLEYRGSTSYDLRVKKGEKLKKIERDRFSDLDNKLTFSMLKNITISERYIYSIRYDKPLTSKLNFTYAVNEVPFIIIDKIDKFRFNTLWNHNIQNPRNSNLHINNDFEIKLAKYWKLNISTRTVNEKLYLYSRSLAKKYQVEETEKNVGEYEYRNFFVDLLNSINIFQPDKMQDSYFKLRNASISVYHDLHCWELGFGYSLDQRFFNYGRITQYPYFEHSFWLKINMKIETEIGVDEKYKTEPPEVEE